MSGASPRLEVTIAGLKFRNPVILASGVLGTTAELIARVAEAGAGGVTTKSVTREPRPGYRNPVVAVVRHGLVNAMGLPNPGIERAVEEVRAAKRELRRYGNVPLIASVASSDPAEACEMASALEDAGADAIELNMSCPHARGYGLEVSRDRRLAVEIARRVRERVSTPLFAKVGLQDDIIDLCRDLERSGVDAIVAINTIRSVVIDIYAKRPVLSNVYGGLSGGAIHPIAVRVVYDLYRHLEIPVIGVGGVESWEDAVEFILAGASAVEVGTAVWLRGLGVFRSVVEGIRRYLEEEGYSSVDEIVGLAHED